MDRSMTESFLGETRYDVIEQFFHESWSLKERSQEYEYRIYITRRCFLLNQLFLRFQLEELSQQKENPAQQEALGRIKEVRQTMMTQYGLFSKAEELAENYLRNGKFPKILIVDELVVNGIEIATILQRLENLVCEAYEMLAETPEYEAQARERVVIYGDRQLKIKYDLMNAIEISVFVRSRQPLLIADRYEKRIRAKKILSAVQWHDYIQDVNFILNVDSRWAGNKSYLPLFEIRGTDWVNSQKSDDWERNELQYHNKKTVLWVNCNRQSPLKNPVNVENKLVFTMSCRLSTEGNEKTARLLPVPFIGKLSLSVMNELIRVMTERLAQRQGETNRFSALIRHLTSKLSLQQEKMQLISFILALISVWDFINDHRLRPETVSFADADLCAMNFGKEEEVKAAFDALWEDKMLLSSLKLEIYPVLERIEVLKDDVQDEDSKSNEDCLLACEDFLIDFNQRQLEELARVRNADMFYGTMIQERDPARCKLSQYLSQSRQESLSKALQSFLILAEYGYCSYNFRFDDETKEAEMVLRTGELSGELSVGRLYRFVPALIKLERFCRINAYHMDTKFHDFAEYLNRNGAFPGLTAAVDRLLASLNARGQSFKEWDIPLLLDIDKPDKANGVRTKLAYSKCARPEEEWAAFTDGRRIDYLKWEFEQQDKIKSELDDFIAAL